MTTTLMTANLTEIKPMTEITCKCYLHSNGTELIRLRRNLAEVHAQLLNADSLEELATACIHAAAELRHQTQPVND